MRAITAITFSSDVEQCVQDALAICGIGAPTGEEGERACWLLDALTETGLTNVRIDKVGNVIARIGPIGPALMLAAHLDTVFPREISTLATRDGSRLTGPGIGDNSLGVAGLLWLARRVAGATLPAPLILAGTVGEEGLGNLRGARHLVSTCDLAEFIAIEGALQHACVIRGVANLRFRVSLSGPGGHSWLDRGAPSAAHALVDMLHELITTTTVGCININAITSQGLINTISPAASALVEFRDSSTDANAAMGRGIPAITVGLAHGGKPHTVEEWADITHLPQGLCTVETLVRSRLRDIGATHEGMSVTLT